MKRLILIAVSLAMFSCTGKKHSQDYYYIDTKGILHANSGCVAVSKIKGGGQPVKVAKITELCEKNMEKLCSQCVSEEQINELQLWFVYLRTLDEEVEEENDNHSLGYQIREWLYYKIKDEFEDQGDWYDFNDCLDNEDSRQKLYNLAVRKGIKMPAYHIFCRDINKYREDETCEIFRSDTIAIETVE